MSAPARLRALRLVGFKSFAERTLVEFGPGISAVVGPNGSGKSNLADALRWTLGEQGRLLRTRRSEDVIFAGSSARRAIGMADVTLVIDNEDRLLPLDYGEVELGRRLYRSGENEYLLNRQRVRLRDLSELLDSANLADNAFLFIGQGMVDQALALRPEERRPLFEEAAGVRRHERRRRHAESELAEAEANLERLRDVLAELRPQARRLAAQAEQLQARRSAGLELAEALVAAARARWVESWSAAQEQQRALDVAHRQSDREMTALRRAEETAERHSRALSERAEREHELRHDLDERRSATVELRLEQARLASTREALLGERRRSETERAELELRMAEARATLAEPQIEDRPDLQRSLEEAQRALAEVEAELAGARQSGPEEGRLRQALLAAELEQSSARLSTLEGQTEAARRQSAERNALLAENESARDVAAQRLEQARAAEARATEALAASRARNESAVAAQAAAAREQAGLEAELAVARGRLAVLDAALAADGDDELVRAALAEGGTPLAEGLEVDPYLRGAVSAALGDVLRAVAVGVEALESLPAGRGVLLLREGLRDGLPAATAEPAAARLLAAVTERGGDRLSAALRRDPPGLLTSLLERCVWVPELDDALAVRPLLPAGWRAVTRAGEVLDDQGLLRLAGGETELEQRAGREDAARVMAELEGRSKAVAAQADRARLGREEAARALGEARAAEERARSELRAAEEAERSIGRRAETALREAQWAGAQAERAVAELAALSEEVTRVQAALAALAQQAGGQARPPATATLEQRRTELRNRRDELADERSRLAGRQRAAEEARRRAEVGLAMAEPRGLELDAELERLAGRLEEGRAGEERLAAQLAGAREQEQRALAQVESLRAAEAEDRRLLQAAEREATEARERLRRCETRSRSAEVAVMEARLHLEGLREQLLVELAGIGPDGLAALREVQLEAGREAAEQEASELSPESLGAELEAALEAAMSRWAEAGLAKEPPPSAARLASLRRQFHALGAGNPFAVEEYAQARERLETLEAQRADLETAMSNTRQLIANLSRLITEQFLTTFAALEGAFSRRFEQLFGGGEAQLSLTLPDDLSATGVEITARPPGKKRQPLAMLSGGERALTAVALLLAMLEVRPVPFCVLDEVDAALDEANIARFSAALRGLADRIQFIVITHNRGTIEAADALYGVTIGDDAVSRIVSLRLSSGPPSDERPYVEVPIEGRPVAAEAGSA
ncbi:MAG TPA: chromosome segregation protein SMC [Candidatus Limnocylindria bacterium]|nr:chromosome segregation protein SMC [Candidatus Limnocylindria bacterium]